MPSRNLIFSGLAAVFVLAGLIVGYRMLGPASVQRAISADWRRVQDLREISSRLEARGGDLPPNLDWFDSDGSTLVRDPVTHQPYEYIRISATKYQLCATFAFSNSEDDPTGAPSFWDHPKGRTCFALSNQQQGWPYRR